MVPHKEISFEKLVQNKSVAIVGNSVSLFNLNYGKEIDAHDVVIRFNKAAPFFCDYDTSKTHGKKTTIWAFWSIGGFIKRVLQNEKESSKFLEKCFYDKKITEYRIQAKSNGYSTYTNEFIDFTCNSNVLNSLGKKLIQSANYLNLEEKKYQSYLLRKANNNLKILEPSIGLITLEWLLCSNPSLVNVYGMDFKKTPTFSEPEKYEKDMKGRVDTRCMHNFWLEEIYAKRRIFSRDNYALRG